MTAAKKILLCSKTTSNTARACHYLTNYRWRQGGAKAPRRLHEGSTKRPWWRREQPRRLHEGFMMPPRSLRNHGGSTKASWTLHDAFAAHPLYKFSGATTVASRSLRGATGNSSNNDKPPKYGARLIVFHSSFTIVYKIGMLFGLLLLAYIRENRNISIV